MAQDKTAQETADEVANSPDCITQPKKRGRPRKVADSENYVKRGRNGYSVVPPICEELLQGETKLYNNEVGGKESPLGTSQKVDSIPTLNRSSTFRSARNQPKTQPVEIPVDENFAKTFLHSETDNSDNSEGLLTNPFAGMTPGDMEKLHLQVKAERCRRDFAFFIQEFWEVIDNAKLKWNWHMDILAKEMQEVAYNIANRRKKIEDIIINVPPRSSKTNIITKLFPVYCWIVDPTITLITSTFQLDLALRQANMSRDLLRSDKFKAYFPHIAMKETQDNKQDYENKAGGWRYSTSVGAAVTGRHCLISICDDPQDPDQANSEPHRIAANSWVNGTLSSRMSDPNVTIFIYVQQRLHPDDVTGMLLSQGLPYKHICLPAEVNDRVQPASAIPLYGESGLLDPVTSPPERLERAKLKMGTRAYQTQYNQSPNSSEDSIIQASWIKTVSKIQWDALQEEHKPVIDFFVDTALTDKKDRDSSAILACAKIGNNLYITAVKTVRMKTPDLVHFLKDWAPANDYTSRSKIIIEPKGAGISVIDTLKVQTGLNVIKLADSKDGKITRLNAIAPIVETGRVFLVDGPWNKDFLDEVSTDTPRHDDKRDAFIWAVENKLAKNQGYRPHSFRFI